MDSRLAALSRLVSHYDVPREEVISSVITSEPFSSSSPKNFEVGTFTLVSRFGRMSTIHTHRNELPCYVFFAVLLLIVSFILATPFSLVCSVPFLVFTSMVIFHYNYVRQNSKCMSVKIEISQ